MPDSSCPPPAGPALPENSDNSNSSNFSNDFKSLNAKESSLNASLPSSSHAVPPKTPSPSIASFPEGIQGQSNNMQGSNSAVRQNLSELSAYLLSLGFELAEELGRGGMGVVYKAKQRDLNRYCALKIINPDQLDNPNLKTRFHREVQATAKLSHPNIVTVFLTNLDGPIPFLAMEYVPGINLLDVLRQRGAIPYANVIQYIRQVADGLQHAFEQGLVHRDIKPANLMITPWPVPAGRKATIKILDMGLALWMNDGGADAALNRVNVMVGTPDYVSPEQAQDSSLVDIRSDLYSLGATMFVMLTARWMFKATSMKKKLKKHRLEVPPLVHSIRPEVPAALSAIVAKLLQKRPEDRFQTPQELIDALDRLTTAPSPTGGLIQRSPMTATGPITFAGHSGTVYALAVSMDGKKMLSGGSDQTIRLWETASRRFSMLQNKGGAVVAVALSPDGRLAATAAARLFDEANQVDLWDADSGKFLGALRGMKYPIQCLAFSHDGRKIAACAEDGVVLIWTLEREKPVVRLPQHKTNVAALAFMAGGKCLLTAAQDGSLTIWDVATAAALGMMPGNVGPLRDIAIGDGRIALAGDHLRILNGDGSLVNFSGYNGPITCVDFSPLRRHVVTGGSDGAVQLWQIDSPNPLEEFPRHSNRTRAVAFAPDGSVFSAGDDSVIRQNFPRTPGLA